MQLTRYTDYAFRTLIYLSQLPAGQRGQIGEVCRVYDISANHLSKVVNELANLGYIQSTRGRGGGIVLGKPAETINIGAVVRAMEPNLKLVDCHQPPCTIATPCRLKHVFAEGLQAFLAVLDRYTLADVIDNNLQALLLIDPHRSKR